MRTLLLLLAVLIGLAGCASSPQETTRYLLRPLGLPQVVSGGDVDRVGIAPVRLAPYLEQPGIVVETAPREVHPAHLHKWAEPLSEGVARYLRAVVSNELGYEVSDELARRRQWSYEIRVSIDEFHGTLAGEARLVAAWTLVAGASNEPVRSERIADREPLTRDGYAGLVEAQTRLLDRLAEQIAGAVPAQ